MGMNFKQWLKEVKHMSEAEYYGVLSSADQEDLYDEYKEYLAEVED